MTYGTLNCDLTTSSTGVNSAGLYGFKNRIINGSMVIDQRNSGASFTPSAFAYTLDRFRYIASQSSKVTMQQNSGSVTPPVGYSNYLGVNSSSAYSITSTDYFGVEQIIEGFNFADLAWGTANAKTVTLSFQVYSSLTGTFAGAFLNSAETRSYPFSYSIPVANTWTAVSITVPGDTTGTWIGATNGAGVKVNFSIGTGSTYSGTAGAWSSSTYFSATGAVSVVGTSGATLYITGVQLEVGTQATSFDYRPYGTELALCQRYFEKSYDDGVSPGSAVVTGLWIGTVSPSQTTSVFGNSNFKVTKRTTATVTVYANNGTSGQVTFPSISSGVAISSLTGVTAVGFPQINFASGQTSSSIGCCSWTASAEL